MVNTFLPFSDFKKCAKVLDGKRLLKQRVEAHQIVNIIKKRKLQEKCGFYNHPAVLMWEDNIDALKQYCNEMILESIERGYKNKMKLYKIKENPIMPWWLGYEHIHYSHQASLLRKNHEHYLKHFINLPNKYRYKGYVWITHRSKSDIDKIKKYLNKEIIINPFKIKDICYKLEKPKTVKNEYYIIKKNNCIYHYPTYKGNIYIYEN
jgi:hypothetical protein